MKRALKAKTTDPTFSRHLSLRPRPGRPAGNLCLRRGAGGAGHPSEPLHPPPGAVLGSLGHPSAGLLAPVPIFSCRCPPWNLAPFTL